MEEDIKELKMKLQIDTDKAKDFINELAEIANKYEIVARLDKSVISFDIADLIKINEIMRLKE